MNASISGNKYSPFHKIKVGEHTRNKGSSCLMNMHGRGDVERITNISSY
jgi:hypothetical protein